MRTPRYGWDMASSPLINLAVAFLVAGLVVLLVGENPLEAAYHLINGAFARANISASRLLRDDFIFTGSRWRFAFHAGLSTSAARVAYVGGIGVALACSGSTRLCPVRGLPLAIVGSPLRRLWAFLPAGCRPTRSHIVITTIMFNFIASSLMVYLLTRVLKPLGSMAPQTRTFAEAGNCRSSTGCCSIFGLNVGHGAVQHLVPPGAGGRLRVWVLIWRTQARLRDAHHGP